MKSNLKAAPEAILKLLSFVSVLLFCASSASAQVAGYKIISTSPTPLIANTAGSVTVRQTGDPTVNGGRLYCGNSLPQSPYPTVVNGSTITLVKRSLPMPPPVSGTELFCDVSFTLPALAQGLYVVRLDLGTFELGATPERSTAIIDLGLLCFGTCVVQQVPLNFSLGAPFWWLALALFIGLGGYTARQRESNRRS